jgi:hypothetical protein
MGYKARFGRGMTPWAAPLIAGMLALLLAADQVRAGNAALKVLLKKGIITQQEYDEALKGAEQAPAAPVEAKPMTQAKGEAAAPPPAPPTSVREGRRVQILNRPRQHCGSRQGHQVRL